MLMWPQALTFAACLALGACTAAPAETRAPTEAEYRAALQATVDCLVAKGFEASLEWSELSNGYATSIDNTQDREAEAEAAYNDCWAEHTRDIELAYQESQRLSGGEREDAMSDLLSCLTGVGVTGLDAGTNDSRVFVKAIWEQLADTPAEIEAMACMERYRGVWPEGDANSP